MSPNENELYPLLSITSKTTHNELTKKIIKLFIPIYKIDIIYKLTVNPYV